MITVWMISIFVLFLMFIAAMTVEFRQFDVILRQIYEFDRDAWNAMGKPPGYFWCPSGSSTYSLKSSFAKGALFKQLLTGKLTEFKSRVISEKHIEYIRLCEYIRTVIFIMMLVDIIVGVVCFWS